VSKTKTQMRNDVEIAQERAWANLGRFVAWVSSNGIFGGWAILPADCEAIADTKYLMYLSDKQTDVSTPPAKLYTYKSRPTRVILNALDAVVAVEIEEADRGCVWYAIGVAGQQVALRQIPTAVLGRIK